MKGKQLYVLTGFQNIRSFLYPVNSFFQPIIQHVLTLCSASIVLVPGNGSEWKGQKSLPSWAYILVGGNIKCSSSPCDTRESTFPGHYFQCMCGWWVSLNFFYISFGWRLSWVYGTVVFGLGCGDLSSISSLEYRASEQLIGAESLWLSGHQVIQGTDGASSSYCRHASNPKWERDTP